MKISNLKLKISNILWQKHQIKFQEMKNYLV